MTHGDDAVEDLKRELLTEMAENFFARRRALESRLEAFAVLREAVARRGLLSLARLRAFRGLLGGTAETDRFLAGLGFDLPRLLALSPPAGAHFPPRRFFALTTAGRYRKAVRNAYDGLRQELEDYIEDSYVPDPDDARRMRRHSGYRTLLAEAGALNTAIAAVNTCQTPSDMVRFVKELDP